MAKIEQTSLPPTPWGMGRFKSWDAITGRPVVRILSRPNSPDAKEIGLFIGGEDGFDIDQVAQHIIDAVNTGEKHGK